MSQFDLQGIGMTSQRTRDRLVARLREQGIEDEAVLQLMGSVPRHIFIDEAWSHRAYEDSSLPIGHGQTISQPFIVALMSQLLNVQPRERVLEVGTGSGYQTAILACLCQRLFSIERIKALVPRAQERFCSDEVAQCQGALWGWLRRMAGKCSIRWHIGYRRTARDTGCTDGATCRWRANGCSGRNRSVPIAEGD